MRNKNIIFNHTLEEYNKRYRNRKQRLLKYTKKEVEEFDIKNKTDIKNFLLEDRKWWFIKDTYYEIPKAPRLVWFRNLNAGAQAGICLLGAGVIATAITVPLVLLNRTNGLSITIDGTDYDKEASHIELHKKSTIKLKEKDKKIIGVEYVKVGDKTLESTEYTFDEDTKVVTINAEAMTSTKIEIKVKTENPHIVDLETWKEKADKLNADFLSSTLEYTLDQITKYVEEGQKKTLKKVEYYNDPLTGREFWVYFDESGGSTVATYLFSGKKLFENGYITDKGICEIYDDEIVYKNENAGDNEYKELHINKFGYPTYQLLGSGDLYEIEFNSEPQPKQETAKEKFLRLYKPYNDAFQNATTVYDATDVTVTIDGKTKIATSILYGKKTELIARKCSIDDNQCIAGGETDFEIDRFSKMLDQYEEKGYTFQCSEDKTNKIVSITGINPEGKIYFMYAFNSYGYLVKNVQGSMITTYSYNGEPHEPVTKATKAQFIAKANEWVTGKNGFCNSILEYKQEQITYKKGDVVTAFDHIEYNGEGQDREFSLYTTGTTYNTVAGVMYSGDNLSDQLKAETEAGVTYEINDDEIIYKDDNAEFIHSSYKELHINKYGYVTLQLRGNGSKDEYIYSGDPAVHKTALQYTPGESGDNSITYVGTPQTSVDAGTQSLKINCDITLGTNQYDGYLYIEDSNETLLAKSDTKTGPYFEYYTFTINLSSIDLNKYDTLYVKAIIVH